MLFLLPKLFSLIVHKNPDLNAKQISKDIIAGIVVAIIALPLSIALGIASGVSPEKGLLTAVIAGFFISFLGGSRVQIGGPTAAFVVIIYNIIQQFGIEGLIIATVMSGIILIAFGIMKFGNVIKFIPLPITVGFTAGIAVTLFSGQVKDFLGMTIETVPAEFIDKWACYFENFNTINLNTVIIGVLTLIILIVWPKINRVIPPSLVALIVATLAVKLFNLTDVATIGSVFGEIKAVVPTLQPINFSLDTIKALLQPAFTIAILAGIESLLSCVVADGMIGKKHDSNQELIGQGVANIVSALLGGIPATGAIARTAANVKNGGRTPIAGMVHAIVLFVIMLVAMPLASLIPMTTLSAILIVVAYNMSEWRAFKRILKAPKSDVAVLLITFFLTIIFDLVIAIEFGMIIAMFLFMKHMADSTSSSSFTAVLKEDTDCDDHEKIDDLNKRITVFKLTGPLFFGAADTFLDIQRELNVKSDILILKMKNVSILDATAFDVLKRFNEYCRKNHIVLFLAEIQDGPREYLEKNGFVSMLGAERFTDTYEQAFNIANELIKIKKKQKIT